MTLHDIISSIERAAAARPDINLIVRQDALKLNTRTDAKYAAFAWVQGTHRATASGDLVRYAFSLFYIDRLTDDGANLLDIQGAGIEAIRSIIASVAESLPVSVQEISFHPFTQRFLDECAGVWADVVITAPASGPCADETERTETIEII